MKQKNWFFLLYTHIILLSIYPISSYANLNTHNLKNGYTENFEEHNSIYSLQQFGWNIKSDFEILESEGSKNHYLYINSENNSKITAVSPFIDVDGEEVLLINAKMHVENVRRGEKAWYVPRLQLQVYDRNKKPVRTEWIASMYGTEDWDTFTKRVILPVNARSIRILIDMNHVSGEAYFDDLEINVEEDMPPLISILNEKSIGYHRLLPVPINESLSDNKIQFKEVTFKPNMQDMYIESELTNFFEKFHINVNQYNKQKSGIIYSSVNIDSEIAKKVMRNADTDVLDVLNKEQGYLLYVNDSNQLQTQIIAISKSSQGRFYALQTFLQLVEFENDVMSVPGGYVADYPYLEKRGVVFGDVRRWFMGEPDPKKGFVTQENVKPYRDWAKELKLNFVWLTGWQGFYSRNASPLNIQDRVLLKQFLEDCEKNFITPSVGFRPYKQTPGKDNAKGGVRYSSDKDVEEIIKNYETLYKLGFRDFHISFDDQEYKTVLQYPEDRAVFKSAGQAHFSFINKVYSEFIEHYPDIKFRVIGMNYNDVYLSKHREYLNALKKLPSGIEFVWAGNNAKTSEKYKRQIGNHSLMIWSNYYPNNYGKNIGSILIHPFVGVDVEQLPFSSGMIFHPLNSINSVESTISWSTAADYMWRGNKYDNKMSLSRALMRLVGHKQFNDFINQVEVNQHKAMYGTEGLTKYSAVETQNNIFDAIMNRCENDIRCELNLH